MATYDVFTTGTDDAGEYSTDPSRCSRTVAAADAFPTPTGGGVIYRMRGYDTDIPSIVFWSAPIVDSTAAYYGGVGPVTNIVVQKVLGA